MTFLVAAIPLIPLVTIWALAWLLLGERLESREVALGVLSFSLAGAWSFLGRPGFWLTLLGQQKGKDAAQLALLGPDVFLNMLVLTLTFVAMSLALLGHSKLSYAANTVAIAVFGLGSVFLRVANSAVGDAAGKELPRSDHLRWQEELNSLATNMPDPSVVSQLKGLAERCRYASNDTAAEVPQNADISRAIDLLKNKIGEGSNDVQVTVGEISDLLTKREQYLRTMRSKA